MGRYLSGFIGKSHQNSLWFATEVFFTVSHFVSLSGDQLTNSRDQPSAKDHLCSNHTENGKEVLDLENDD